MTTTSQILLLAGSAARGELDDTSDIDLVAVYSDPAVQPRVTTDMWPIPVDVSHYRLATVQRMWSSGHLFAWHLYLEAIPLGPSARAMLANLGKPTANQTCGQEAKDLLQDLEHSHSQVLAGSPNSIYEAGISYVCIRNIAIHLSWFTTRGLNFSRLAPWSRNWGGNLPGFTKQQYLRLYECRLAARQDQPYTKLPLIGRADLERSQRQAIAWAHAAITATLPISETTDDDR